MKLFKEKLDWIEITRHIGTEISDENVNIFASVFCNPNDLFIRHDLEWLLYKHSYVPVDELNIEILKFREVFPKENRHPKLINRYFDDRLEGWIRDFVEIQNSPIKMEILILGFQVKENRKQLERFPIRNFEDAKNRYEKTAALSLFVSELKNFDKSHGNGFEKAYRDTLKELDEFIEKAELMSVNDAFNNLSLDNQHHQYLRLKYDYYKNHNSIDRNDIFSPIFVFVGGQDARIYGRYFLFRDWLISKLEKTPKRKTRHKIDAVKLGGALRMPRLNNESKTEFIEQWLTEKQNTKSKIEILGNFNDEYNGMFVVSKSKRLFSDKELIKRSIKYPQMNNKYDLQNENIYDENTGKLLKKGTRTDFNSAFLLKLDDLYVLDVKPFLSYQFNNSEHPKQLLDYVKYATLNSSIVTNRGVKTAIQDWLDESRVSKVGEPPKPPKAFRFNNNFDDVEQAKVFNHFNKGLVIKGYLSEEDLKKYLTIVFDKRKKIDEKFSFTKSATKQRIRNCFYTYYRDVAGKPHGRQREYVQLLGDYFLGFNTKSLTTNFSK